MSLEEMKAITRRFALEPWGKGNLQVLDEVCDPNYQLGTSANLQILKDVITEYRQALPDLSIEIGTIVAEGDHVAYQWKMQGTHQNTFHGIHATGKTVIATGITIVRFENGKIIEDKFESSSPTFEAQVGS